MYQLTCVYMYLDEVINVQKNTRQSFNEMSIR